MRIIPLTAVALLVLGTTPAAAREPSAADSVDEIHYEYGAAAGTVVLDWHGPATSVSYGITYGHRPAYSSVAADTDANLRSALTTLAAAYSPTSKHPAGKFVLNVAHHVHAEEVFKAMGGLVEVNDGGGGAGQVTLSKPASGSILRITHMAVMRGDYDVSAHTLTMTILCGAVYTPNPKFTCTYAESRSTRRPSPRVSSRRISSP
jgi:hypothetical protein